MFSFLKQFIEYLTSIFDFFQAILMQGHISDRLDHSSNVQNWTLSETTNFETKISKKLHLYSFLIKLVLGAQKSISLIFDVYECI
jgi:hypothetical protein